MRDIFTRRWGATFVLSTDGTMESPGASYHTAADLGLLPAASPVFEPAEPKYIFTDIPGADGGVDRTEELTGYVVYSQTSGVMSYYVRGSDRKRRAAHTRLKRLLHGKLARIILDEDRSYFRWGRIWVGDLMEVSAAGRVDISARVDPYKYELISAKDAWLWDPFSFVDGVIRSYAGLTHAAGGTNNVTVVSSPRGGVPKITSTAAMTMIYDGTSYSVPAGTTEFPEIELPHEQTECLFKFTGSTAGTFSIDFRPGVL